ncbi:hypothetical protein GCM10009844_44720 [Nocardioides koreensis]|uniref:DUF3558 domain-containing protein n=1 Tax=Nocardioides koreensis TaxID=433651 RepID=A0ABP5LYD4_9ACTN
MLARRPRLAVALLLPLLLLTACTDDGSAPTTAPSAPPTPLESLSTRDLAVARVSFCPMVPPDAVKTALGAEPAASTAYDNGDPAWVTREVKDVAHEYGCVWRAKGGASARAWVFAPPITRARAQDLVRSSVRRGCAKVAGPDFGAPSVTTRCRTPKGGVQEGHFGLFGDAWLSCTLGARAKQDRADLAERASRWCAAVVTAAGS